MAGPEQQNLRWGVLGSSGIVNAFMGDLPYTQRMTVSAVCSRTAAGAEAFAERYGTPTQFIDLNEMLRSGTIDALYIATPHSTHADAAAQALQAGIAVLVEKPAAINVAQWHHLTALARMHKTFLMEALWTDFLPSTERMRQLLADDAIGRLRSLHVSFGFVAPDDPAGRLLNPALAGGALLDIGIYGLYHAWRWLGEPEHWETTAELAVTGVDVHDQLILRYADGRTAYLHFALDRELPHEATLHGEKGWLRMSTLCDGRQLTQGGGHDPAEVIYQRTEPGGGFVHEMQHATDCIQAGLLESPQWRWDDTLRLQTWMEQLRKDWGVRFPGEDKS